MASVAKNDMEEEVTPKGKPPLKIRLKAWWEGFDPDDLMRSLGDADDSEEKSPAKPAAASPAPQKEQTLPPPTPTPQSTPDQPIDTWGKDRIDVAQYIWGKGFCGPGGPEHIVAMSKLLALTPELSMVELGAGLGGVARTLAEQFGVWMTGYEHSPALVQAGNEMSTMSGMAKKAPLVEFDPEKDEEFDRRYDRALAKEFVYTVENKSSLLQRLEKALKPEGLVLLTDYVISDESVLSSADYAKWRDGEPHKPFMITQKELGDMITKAGLTVRVNEDQTKSQVELITQAWQGVEKVVSQLVKNPEEHHLVDVLFKEAELWNRRVTLMNAGKIQYVRILGAKREVKKGMMSDW